jgi:hypothetical protein
MKHMRINRGKIFVTVILFFNLIGLSALADQSGLQIPDQVTGDLAYGHVYYISEEIGARPVGGTKEEQTADYLIEQFERLGYDVEIQPFSFKPWWSDETYESENIVATKQGKFDQTVIVGAHYDSESESTCEDIGQTLTGAGDNASGIAVMLEAAEILKKYKTNGTIKFVAFGAEELGLWGSYYYASQMSEDEIANTVTMVNLDSVGVGDHFNVYAGIDDNPGWARDLAIKIGQGIGHDLRTSPQHDCQDYGTAGDWSDHVAFRLLGIPIAYFEWMNWEIEPCEGIETEEYGWIMHTCRDNLSFVSKDKLEMTAEVVTALVFQLSKNKLPKTEKGKAAKGNKYISVRQRY